MAKGIGHILCRNCPIKHTIEGKIEETGRWGRRRKQLLNGLKGNRVYWRMKEEALRSHSVENSLGKRLWASHKTDYILNHTFQRLSFSWNLCYVFLSSYKNFIYDNFST